MSLNRGFNIKLAAANIIKFINTNREALTRNKSLEQCNKDLTETINELSTKYNLNGVELFIPYGYRRRGQPEKPGEATIQITLKADAPNVVNIANSIMEFLDHELSVYGNNNEQ